MTTQIVINEVVPGLNGDNGLIREHYKAAKRRKDRYLIMIMEQTRNRHKGMVNISLVRHSVTLMDWDNMCASFKHLGDALVKAKVIKDDKPSIIKSFFPVQWRCEKRKNQMTIINITDVH